MKILGLWTKSSVSNLNNLNDLDDLNDLNDLDNLDDLDDLDDLNDLDDLDDLNNFSSGGPVIVTCYIRFKLKKWEKNIEQFSNKNQNINYGPVLTHCQFNAF